MARAGLLWLLGIPIPILLLMWVFGWLHYPKEGPAKCRAFCLRDKTPEGAVVWRGS
jgi:hypothetical protein